jgi:hypothetical protein
VEDGGTVAKTFSDVTITPPHRRPAQYTPSLQAEEKDRQHCHFDAKVSDQDCFCLHFSLYYQQLMVIKGKGPYYPPPGELPLTFQKNNIDV